MAKVKKIPQKPTKVLVHSTAALVLATIGILAVTNLIRVSVDCAEVVKKAQALINNEQHSQAHHGLLAYEKKCAQPVAKNESTESKITKLNYHSRLAVAAYVAKDERVATDHANKGLAIMGSQLSEKEQQTVQTTYVSDMIFVQAGLY